MQENLGVSIWDLRKILKSVTSDILDANYAAALSIELHDRLIEPENQSNTHVWDYILQALMWRLFLALARLTEHSKTDRHNIRRLISDCEKFLRSENVAATVPNPLKVKEAINSLHSTMKSHTIKAITENRNAYIVHKLSLADFSDLKHRDLLDLAFELSEDINRLCKELECDPEVIDKQMELSKESAYEWGETILPEEFCR